MIEGFLPTFYSFFILFAPTEPPMMRTIEGMDYVIIMYRQAFLFSGVIGIFVAIVGGISFWKERTGKRDMRKRKLKPDTK